MPDPLTQTRVRMGLGHKLATSFRETGPGRGGDWGGKRLGGLIPSPEGRHRAGEQGAPEGTEAPKPGGATQEDQEERRSQATWPQGKGTTERRVTAALLRP